MTVHKGRKMRSKKKRVKSGKDQTTLAGTAAVATGWAPLVQPVKINLAS